MSLSDVTTAPAEQTLQSVLETAESEIHVLNPAPAVATRLLDVYNPEQHPRVSIYAPKSTYDAGISTFPFILTAASKTGSDDATLLELPESAPLNAEHANTVATDDYALSLLWDDDEILVFGIEKATLATALIDQATGAASDVTEYELRAPPREVLLEAFEDRVGEPYVEQYVSLLDEIDELPCRYNQRAAIDTAIIAGALTESQLYHISRATESAQFGSIASFSRRKNELEEAGYIDTEKVPTDIGRPRDRLVPGDELEPSTDGVVGLLHSLHHN
jgi:hypothetical protein